MPTAGLEHHETGFDIRNYLPAIAAAGVVLLLIRLLRR